MTKARRLHCSLAVALSVSALLASSLPAEAGPSRSAKARAEFVKANPCPATGRHRGACPGWEVDHIQPLKCKGEDSPQNMQWLTVEQHKLKTKREARLCRSGSGNER